MSWGTETPIWSWSPKSHSSQGPWVHFSGSRVWEPLRHVWIRLAWPQLTISNKEGPLVPADPVAAPGEGGRTGTLPLWRGAPLPWAVVAPRGQGSVPPRALLPATWAGRAGAETLPCPPAHMAWGGFLGQDCDCDGPLAPVISCGKAAAAAALPDAPWAHSQRCGGVGWGAEPTGWGAPALPPAHGGLCGVSLGDPLPSGALALKAHGGWGCRRAWCPFVKVPFHSKPPASRP